MPSYVCCAVCSASLLIHYRQIATLPAQYGLYSSFVGVLIYCVSRRGLFLHLLITYVSTSQFFATSKDVSIGPVAVMSLTVAQIIKEVQKVHHTEWEGPQIATTLAFMCGFIVLGIGLL